jgi:hypothetical protein
MISLSRNKAHSILRLLVITYSLDTYKRVTTENWWQQWDTKYLRKRLTEFRQRLLKETEN